MICADTRTGDCVSINRDLGLTGVYLLVTFVNKHNINCINGSIRMICLHMGHETYLRYKVQIYFDVVYKSRV